MFEEILKNQEFKIEFLKRVITKVQTNEGDDIPEISKELAEIVPFFAEDDYFIKEVNRNFRKLKQVFKDDEYNRAIAYVRARKVRNHVTKRAEEALGYREIANGKFDVFHIVAKRIEPAIRKDVLIEKTNYSSSVFTLTDSNGFKELDNYYHKAIIDVGKSIVDEINSQGYYNPDLTEIVLEWQDPEDKSYVIKMPLRLTCEKIEQKRRK